MPLTQLPRSLHLRGQHMMGHMLALSSFACSGSTCPYSPLRALVVGRDSDIARSGSGVGRFINGIEILNSPPDDASL